MQAYDNTSQQVGANYDDRKPDESQMSVAMRIRLGHSPDADDAFMFYGLACGRIETGRYEIEQVLRDIQTLNEWALQARLEVTAISIHAYPYVQDCYLLLDCGASMGQGYGPVVVARRSMPLADLAGATVAVPGTMTTAFLVLSLLLGKDGFKYRVMPFDAILPAVAAGQAEAGLIIHEGQLTYQDDKLVKLIDLGQWWAQQTHLPLPLGGNVIRRDLGREAIAELAGLLRGSIVFSLEHRREAIDHALQYARGMDRDLAERFVGMYVNRWTLSYGQPGRQAVAELLDRAHRAGITPRPARLEFAEPAS
ncbi:MAG: menaquinone biosynthesis family protein [Phycisphaerae bacterium]